MNPNCVHRDINNKEGAKVLNLAFEDSVLRKIVNWSNSSLRLSQLIDNENKARIYHYIIYNTKRVASISREEHLIFYIFMECNEKTES